MTDRHEGSRGQRARKAQARSVLAESELFCLRYSAAAGQLVLLGTVVPDDDDGGRRISRMVEAGAGAAVATSADRPLDAASSARGQFHGQGQRELSSSLSLPLSLSLPWTLEYGISEYVVIRRTLRAVIRMLAAQVGASQRSPGVLLRMYIIRRCVIFSMISIIRHRIDRGRRRVRTQPLVLCPR
jgi:hypothetical protein